MYLLEIKNAIADGKNVYWKNFSYKVIKDSKNQYLIKCGTNSIIGLTWADDITFKW